jgi:RNA polymerase sigma-70 factor (ECF subfamily)
VPEADIIAAEYPGVFRYLCRVVGRADVARDLTQEVFLRVSRAAAPVEDGLERRAWVFKIARNLALNHLRDTHRRPVAVELAEAVRTRPATQELAALLKEALGALPDLDRDIFLLREAGGLSYDEIAQACELTPDAVRSRLHRARQQLRQDLAAPLQSERAAGIRLPGQRLNKKE